MRVRGNNSPETLTIERYLPKKGCVEVRIRQNPIEVVETYEDLPPVTLYEFDEYIFHVLEEENLREKIEQNLDEWVEWGKDLEVNMQSSVIYNMQEESIKEIAAIIEDVYNEDLATIEE